MEDELKTLVHLIVWLTRHCSSLIRFNKPECRIVAKFSRLYVFTIIIAFLCIPFRLRLKHQLDYETFTAQHKKSLEKILRNEKDLDQTKDNAILKVH